MCAHHRLLRVWRDRIDRHCRSYNIAAECRVRSSGAPETGADDGVGMATDVDGDSALIKGVFMSSGEEWEREARGSIVSTVEAGVSMSLRRGLANGQ